GGDPAQGGSQEYRRLLEFESDGCEGRLREAKLRTAEAVSPQRSYQRPLQLVSVARVVSSDARGGVQAAYPGGRGREPRAAGVSPMLQGPRASARAVMRPLSVLCVAGVALYLHGEDVLVDGQVLRKGSNTPVPSLQAKDLRSLEDGGPQEIRPFSRDELP